MKAIKFDSASAALSRAEQEKREGFNAMMYYSQKHNSWYVVRGSSTIIAAIEMAIAGAVGVGHLLKGGFNIARSKLRHLKEKHNKAA